MVPTIPRTATRAAACPRLTQRQRAAVRLALASAAGDGLPTTREQVVAELFGAPATARDAITVELVATTPTTTPGVPVTPADGAVSLADAAARLGLTVKTVRRYLAPSSGKLARLGDGVSLASVEAVAAAR